MCLGRDLDVNASRSLIFKSQELRKMWLFIQRLMGELCGMPTWWVAARLSKQG